MGGWGVGGNIALIDGKTEGSIEIGPGWAYNAMLAVRPRSDEGGLIVLSYQRQRTHFRLNLQGRPPGSFEVDIGHLQIGGEVDGRLAERLRPFFAVTLGATHYSPRSSSASTEWFFSAGFYGGVKVPLNSHFGLRFQGRRLGTVLSSNSAVVCASSAGGACLVTVDEVTGPIQGDMMGGFYLAF